MLQFQTKRATSFLPLDPSRGKWPVATWNVSVGGVLNDTTLGSHAMDCNKKQKNTAISIIGVIKLSLCFISHCIFACIYIYTYTYVYMRIIGTCPFNALRHTSMAPKEKKIHTYIFGNCIHKDGQWWTEIWYIPLKFCWLLLYFEIVYPDQSSIFTLKSLAASTFIDRHVSYFV